MLIGGVVILLAIIGTVVGVVVSKKSDDGSDGGGGGGDGGLTENPMIGVFAQQPDLSLYTKGGKNTVYDDNFWKNDAYGGQITDPINIQESSEATRVIKNAFSGDLTDMFSARNKNFGKLYTVKNL